jgi:hypothetical protein
LYSRHLITLATEINLVAALDTLVDVYMQNLSLYNSFLAKATLAPVLVTDNFTFALTVWTDGLKSLDHWSHLSHHGLHTCTIAARACLDSAFLASAAITSWANDGFLQGQLRDLAAVDVFKRDLMDVVDCASLFRAGVSHPTTEHAAECAATAKELRKQVFGIHAAGTASLFKTLLAILIVHLSLLGIL